MNHLAIYALYPQVVKIESDVAYDASGSIVQIDAAAVDAWTDPNQYQRKRASEYPSIAEQLDMQYWDGVNGTTVWADTIAAIKAKHPKGA